MAVRVVVEPTVEPVSVSEAKEWLREDETEQDAVIAALIAAARIYAENYTRRAFVTQTLELMLDAWPCEIGQIVVLPRPPLQSVEFVKYTDLSGVLQTIDPADYQVDTDQEPGRIAPAWLKWWPSIRVVLNPIRIRYVAGYAPVGSPTDYASGVPANVKQWMKARIYQLYEYRAAILEGGVTAIPRDSVDGLLDQSIVSLF